MKKMITTLAAFAVMGTASVSQGQVLFDFTAAAGDFTFAAFDGGVSDATGFSVNLEAGSDNFGGVGANDSLLATPEFDGDTEFLIEATLGPGNTSDLVFAVREAGAPGEFFSVLITAADLADGQAIVTPSAFFFNGDTTDGIPGGTVAEVSFQSPFGGTAAVDFTLERISIVPEPASAALIGLGGLALLGRRRRQA